MTQYLRKVGTRECFVATNLLRKRGDMVACASPEAALTDYEVEVGSEPDPEYAPGGLEDLDKLDKVLRAMDWRHVRKRVLENGGEWISKEDGIKFLLDTKTAQVAEEIQALKEAGDDGSNQ